MKLTSTKKWIIGLIATAIVSLIAGGVLSPIIGAYMEDLLKPKPAISIVREETCIVPMMGENWVIVRTVVRNRGSAPEQNIEVRFEVDSPWICEEDSTWSVLKIDNLPGKQARMIVIRALNPSVTQLQHGSFHVVIRVFGETKTWDTAEFFESW